MGDVSTGVLIRTEGLTVSVPPENASTPTDGRASASVSQKVVPPRNSLCVCPVGSRFKMVDLRWCVVVCMSRLSECD